MRYHLPPPHRIQWQLTPLRKILASVLEIARSRKRRHFEFYLQIEKLEISYVRQDYLAPVTIFHSFSD